MTKVKVGQVWANPQFYPNYTFQIVRIEGNRVYAKKINLDGVAVTFDTRFGSIDNNGCPLNWDPNWKVQEDKSSAPKQNNYNSDFDFFKRPSQSDHCVCRIPKTMCTYHK